MAQPKNLIDSFMAGLMQEAKAAVDSVTIELPTKQNPIEREDEQDRQNKGTEGAGSGQGRVSVGTRAWQDHSDDTFVTPLGHHRDTIVTPLKPKKGQDKGTTQKEQGRDTIQKEIKLAEKQLLIYKWFLQNGLRSTFNKPLIMEQTGIAFTTIRKALRKFENIGLLRFTYDDCTKLFEYEINNKISVKNLDLGQGRGRVGAAMGQGQDPHLNSSSSYIRTTIMQNSETARVISEIMSSDPEYKYWTDQQVTPKQIETWKNEFGIDLQTILNNLCYARWQIVHQKSEINKSPANFIYGIMKKNGGTVNKPAGYKTMAQMELEFYETWRKNLHEHRQQIEQIKDDAIKEEIEPKVAAILESPDLENEDLREAIEGIHSEKRKSIIINTIKSGKSLAEGERLALKGCLQMVLKKKALKELTF